MEHFYDFILPDGYQGNVTARHDPEILDQLKKLVPNIEVVHCCDQAVCGHVAKCWFETDQLPEGFEVVHRDCARLDCILMPTSMVSSWT